MENFNNDNFLEGFEALEGRMAHSDIYYMKMITDLFVVLRDVIEAYADRNPEKEVENLRSIIIAGLMNVIYLGEIVLSADELLSYTKAVIKIIKGEAEGEE